MTVTACLIIYLTPAGNISHWNNATAPAVNAGLLPGKSGMEYIHAYAHTSEQRTAWESIRNAFSFVKQYGNEFTLLSRIF